MQRNSTILYDRIGAFYIKGNGASAFAKDMENPNKGSSWLVIQRNSLLLYFEIGIFILKIKELVPCEGRQR